jgi:hypothetical protein
MLYTIPALKTMTLKDLRLPFLYGILLFYALFSSPTPDSPGLIETIIGIGLIIVSLPSIAELLAKPLSSQPLWRVAGIGLIFYGLIVSVVMGVWNGNEIHYILRDVIPFLYLFLPLFMAAAFQENPAQARRFMLIACMMGFLFAVRSMIKSWTFLGFDFSGVNELYYLANAPTVLLASCLSVFGALHFATSRISIMNVSKILICIVVALSGVVAMALTLQRASLGVVVLYTLMLLIIFMIKKPLRTLPILVFIVVIMLPFAQDIAALAEALINKTSLHGLNNRTQEWLAVWNEATRSWGRFILGGGWGTTFDSPAVDGERVNFTHSLLSSMLLKGGITGLFLTIFYLAGFAGMLVKLACRDIIITAALAAPFLIDVFLYGSYKTLDFGVLLLLVPVTLFSGCVTNKICTSPQSHS